MGPITSWFLSFVDILRLTSVALEPKKYGPRDHRGIIFTISFQFPPTSLQPPRVFLQPRASHLPPSFGETRVYPIWDSAHFLRKLRPLPPFPHLLPAFSLEFETRAIVSSFFTLSHRSDERSGRVKRQLPVARTLDAPPPSSLPPSPSCYITWWKKQAIPTSPFVTSRVFSQKCIRIISDYQTRNSSINL